MQSAEKINKLEREAKHIPDKKDCLLEPDRTEFGNATLPDCREVTFSHPTRRKIFIVSQIQ